MFKPLGKFFLSEVDPYDLKHCFSGYLVIEVVLYGVDGFGLVDHAVVVGIVWAG